MNFETKKKMIICKNKRNYKKNYENPIKFWIKNFQ